MLKSLIVKEAEIAEELIEKVITPYCKYAETGKILPNEKFRQLPLRLRILVYLTGKRGLKFIIEEENANIIADNAELEKVLGVKGNTLRPQIKKLRDEGLLVTEKAMHTISDHAPFYIIDLLKLA